MNEINHRLFKNNIWIIIVCLILNVFWLPLVTQVNLVLILQHQELWVIPSDKLCRN